jgi:hypothetical protein
MREIDLAHEKKERKFSEKRPSDDPYHLRERSGASGAGKALCVAEIRETSPMSTLTKTKQVNADTVLLAGIQKHFANGTFTIQGQPETTAQIAAVIQGRIDKETAITTAKTAWHAAVLASRDMETSTASFVADVRQTILAMYSNSPQVLDDCGVTARKPPTPLTAAQQVVAAAKRKATRAARHTMSPNQKAGVTGSLTGPVTVQLDGSASPPSPQPAAPAAAPVAANGTSTLHASRR